MTEREGWVLPSPPLPVSSTEWALFLDVDGTLIDFAETPDAVHVPAGLISLLLRLQHRLHGALALISGRRIASLDNLFRPLVLPAAGLHGFEHRDERGVMRQALLESDVSAPLHRRCREIADAFPQVLVEDKQFSVAFHYRNAVPERERLRAALTAIAQELQFELLEGHFVFEVKPAAINKGSALVEFMSEPPFAGRLPIFLGDDITDNYALSAAREHGGTAIQVDNRIHGAAQFGLPNPQAVMQWLHDWEEQFQ